MKKQLLILFALCSLLLCITQKTQAQGSALSASIPSYTNILCANANTGSATAYATGGTAPYTYSWAPLPGTDVTISGLNAGNYTITVTDIYSDVATASVTITQPTPLNLSPTYINNVTCRGYSNGSAGVNANGGVSPYAYLWSPGGGTNTSESGLSGGSYSVTVTDANSCTANTGITISLQSDPSATVTQVNEPSCFGNSNGSTTGAVTGGVAPYTYLWLPGGATTPTATNLSAATYTLQVHDALGCSATTSSTVFQPSPLQLTLHYGDSVISAITTGGTAPYTYKWYPNVSTNAIATGLSPGTYTVTVNDANRCSDSLIANYTPDTLINFSLSNPTVDCGEPSYVNFTIRVSCTYPVNFDYCLLQFYSSGGEFTGDNVNNGGVLVTQDDSFPNEYYYPWKNDYVLNTSPGPPGITRIQLGYPNGNSPEGTVIDTIPRDIFHVKLRIQNSCQPGSIFFDTASGYQAYFTKVDSSYSGHKDSTKIDSLYGGHLCPIYREPADTVNRHCCDTDFFDSTCVIYCYDSSYTIIGYDSCYDTATIYHVYSVYIIHSKSSWPFETIGYYSDKKSAPSCPLNIDDRTSPINAGTNKESDAWIASIPNNSSIMLITGSGFGGTKGRVKVSDANSNGILTLDSSDIWTWSENLIKIKMPSVLFNNANGTPGSGGPFILYDACGDSALSNLQINYSINNVTGGSPVVKLKYDIVMKSPTSSLIFQCDTSISNYPQILACVKKAIREWNCYTGVNWRLGASDTLEATAFDGISAIYFSSSNFAPSGRAMETQLWPLNSGSPANFDQTDSVAFYDEADIAIKRDGYLAIDVGKHWSYDTIGIQTSTDSGYFYDFILHELGHAHGLEHINDTSCLMYWKLKSYKRYSITSGGAYPGPGPLLGALDMVKTSSNYPTTCCGYTILVTSTRQCTDPNLSEPEIEKNTYNINLFPNPIDQGNITIAYQVTQNSYIQFKILDCIGRAVLILGDENKPPGIYSEQININSLARGVYLFTANINGEFQTVKFIKI